MKCKNTAVIFFSILILTVALFFVTINTKLGSKFITKKLISSFVSHQEMNFKDLEGTLGSGITFQNLEIKDIKNLPIGTTLKVQSLFLNLDTLNFKGIHVEIENARLRLPDSDPIVISGKFKNEQLDFRVYSNGFTVTEVLAYLPDLKNLIPIKGVVNDIDLHITGSYLDPVVKGNFIINKFLYNGFLLAQVPITVDIQIKDAKGNIQLFGNVYLEKGDLKTNKTLIKLDKGDLKFSGPWNQPQINLKGTSVVEKTTIKITLKGTIEKPELILISEPSYSQQKLMVMLATGKSWQSIEGSIENGLDSAALTKDFIDYFFFAGKSNQFAKKFGISEFSVKLDNSGRGISAKKDITNKLQVGYGIEQVNGKDINKDVTQTLEGAYNVSDKISVGVEREIKQKQTIDTINEQTTENKDKVYIKYKVDF